MKSSCLRIAALSLLLLQPSAPAQGTTHLIWVLDAGSQLSPSPRLVAFRPDGVEIINIPIPGSSQGRAMSFGADGSIYVCRGNEVRVLDRSGSDTGIVLTAPSGSSKAQDVLVRGLDQVWVSFGANATSARLCRYDLTGAAAGNLAASDVFGPGLMDHPRRICAPPDATPDRIFIANRTTNELLVFDTLAQTFAVASNLSGNSIGPVGLSYDVTRDSVWVAGDWAQTTEIGLVSATASPAPFTTALNFGLGAVPGLEAPGGLFFDRFRRLYVASRDANNGFPGIYIFRAETGNSLTVMATFPTGTNSLVNVVDVGAQPIEASICGPVDENSDLIIQTGALNPYTIRAPAFAGAFYVAALSSPWATFSPNYVPGILDPAFSFNFQDPRGLPFTCDFVFQLTTGVSVLGGPSLWGSPPAAFPCGAGTVINANQIDLNLAAFVGTLDVAGEATLLMEHLGNIPANGMDLNFSFMTIDFNIQTGIGLIMNPVALKIRTSPTTVTICP